MEPDLSIQITFLLAAQEATADEFERIEPSHFFMAGLKFAELEDEVMKTIVGDDEALKHLVNERNQIRGFLRLRQINVPEKSKIIRRGLRKQLGRGGHPHNGEEVVHRSTASRAVCAKAETIAGSRKAHRWNTLDLLQALLDSPTKEIAGILAAAGIQAKNPADTPAINKYGRDLSRATALRPEEIAKDPVCKVLLDNFSGNSSKSVLLIQKGKRGAETIVAQLAHLGDGSAISPLARIVEVDLSTKVWQELLAKPPEAEKAVGQMLRESKEAGGITIFFKDLRPLLESKGGVNCAELIRQSAAKGAVCIAGIDEAAYKKTIQDSRIWKNVFRSIWIHDVDLPCQL